MNKGLKNVSNISIILGSLVLLGMSYGVLTPSYIVVGIWFIFQGVISTIEISSYDKDYIDKIFNNNTIDNFLKEGKIIGSIRLVLYISLILTLITFNLFAWQLYLLTMVYAQFILYNKAKQYNIDIYKK